MATKEYFPGIGKIKFEGVEKQKTRWLSVIMMQKKSFWANR